MFEMPEVDDSIVRIDTQLAALSSPVWTENKARLIQRYIRYFILVTKHGTYIDAFAGPQVEEFNDESWSARLVLELKPDWMRRFILCELNPEQCKHVESLIEQRRAIGDKRNIQLLKGDCNTTLPAALVKAPIRPKEATFCLLDQRTFECSWETVQMVARHKAEGHKIEIFYFLPVGWLHRSMSGLKDDSKLKQWWGGDDVTELRAATSTQALSHLFTKRFQIELQYKSVMAWPIYEKADGEGRVMYYMIHATDHPEAPKLMNRAYKKTTGAGSPLEPQEQVEMDFAKAGIDADTLLALRTGASSSRAAYQLDSYR